MQARLSSLGGLLLLAGACAHAPVASPPVSAATEDKPSPAASAPVSSATEVKPAAPPDRDAMTIDLAPMSESTPQDVSAAKLGYGAGRAAEWAKRWPTTKNDSGDDFTIELAGRRAELDVWKQLHSKDQDAELAQALLSRKRPDAALPLLEATLTMTKDPCLLARAWRKLGYARFDQGRFAESADAYERSLKYEPGNRLAMSELKLLRDAMVKHGVSSSSAANDYGPMLQITSRCQDSGGD